MRIQIDSLTVETDRKPGLIQIWGSQGIGLLTETEWANLTRLLQSKIEIGPENA